MIDFEFRARVFEEISAVFPNAVADWFNPSRGEVCFEPRQAVSFDDLANLAQRLGTKSIDLGLSGSGCSTCGDSEQVEITVSGIQLTGEIE